MKIIEDMMKFDIRKKSKEKLDRLRVMFEDKRAAALLAVWLAGMAAVLISALSTQSGSVSYYYSAREYSSSGIQFYAGSPASQSGESGTDVAETVNINTASVYDLAGVLPGVGEKKARAIVEHRQIIGGFSSVDELIEVDGISAKLLEKIRPYCRVSDSPAVSDSSADLQP